MTVRAPESCLAALCALALALPAAAALPVPERVSIPSLERDAAGAAVAIPALYFRPDVAAGTRVPLVIAVHGCGGMYSAAASRAGQLSERFGAWTELLLRDGYAVLWPDSFAPRARREICTIRTGDRTITAATRRLDVLGALAFAARLPDVDRARIALVGWSHGGSTALATIDAKDAQVAAFRAAPDAPPFFVAAVAFYPGCAGPLRQGARWAPGAPTAIHIGASDDWTPAAPCVELGYAMRERARARHGHRLSGQLPWLRRAEGQGHGAEERAQRREPGTGRYHRPESRGACGGRRGGARVPARAACRDARALIQPAIRMGAPHDQHA